MGEEVKMSDQYETNGGGNDDNAGDDERVVEWEAGLPSADDLTPLSQALIPLELASAFSITPEPSRTVHDVNRASQSTISSLRGGGEGGEGRLNVVSSNEFKSLSEDGNMVTDAMVVEAAAEENNGAVGTDREGVGSDSRKLRKVMESEEADSALRVDNSAEDPSSAAARTLKRPRLVWTPQLHKRFVDVVAHLGIKNAVPKTIMQLMNVEGLTRENVASHLQKYRLYLKRMQGLSSEGPSSSDQLFASTPVPQSLHESSGGGGGGGGGGGSSGASANGGGGWSGAAHGNGHLSMPIPVPYHPGAGAMMPMPVYGHMGMQMGNHHHPPPHPPPPPPPHHHSNGFDGSVPYNMLQHRDWNVHNYGYHHPHHVAPNDNM